MNIQLLADSGVDFHPTLLPEEKQHAKFKVSVDNESIQQDSTLSSLLKKITSSNSKITTAAPAPYDFLEHLTQEKDAFIVTISSKLSGSYQNAMIAKSDYESSHPKNKVHVFDTESAASGESLVYIKIKELLELDTPFEEIVESINDYIKHLHTLFIINSLDTLYAAGRIAGMAAKLGKLLQIVPIMGEDGSGNIILKAKARGSKQAFQKLLDLIEETKVNFKETVLGITHVNAKELALQLKTDLSERFHFKDIHIFEANNISTVYAGEGGVVLAF